MKSQIREQYELFNDVCEENIWKKLLNENICELNERLKSQFKDDFLMYFSIKNNFCYVVHRLAIFSVFEHLLNCTRVSDTMKNYCKFCSCVTLTKTDNQRMFEDIVIDEIDFTKSFLNSFKPKLVFYIKICHLYFVQLMQGSRRFINVCISNLKKAPGRYLFIF